jgi:NADH:ubiquinone oxidoreductase subunit D
MYKNEILERKRIHSAAIEWPRIATSSTTVMYCFEEQNAFYLISAARIHSAYVRSGGVAFDLRLGFIEDIHKWCEGYARRADELDDLLTGNCSWNQRTVGIGVVYVLEIYVERKKCDKV